MPHALSALVARTTRAVVPSPTDTDGELVTRFARTHDEAAFAELVRRLGPMVLGACQRIAPDPHTAEDAFQAAFLVLARRAGHVRPAEAVRGWVYGVAVRCAKETRAVNARRRASEVPVPTVPDRPAEPIERPDTDALRALDEEVARLPEHLRAAVMLCELDGLSRKDAAERLSIPDGTLSSRLAKARKLLAERLRARGLAVPVGGLTALVHATVSPRLLAQTSALASTGAAISPAVAGLTNGVLRLMLAQKLKATLPLAVGVLGALTCAALAAEHDQPAPVQPPKPLRPLVVLVSRTAAPIPRAAPREGVLLFTSLRPGPTIHLRTPSGEDLPAPALGGASAPIQPGAPPTCTLLEGRLSPNGKRVAAFKLGPIPQNLVGPWTPQHLWVFDLDAKDGPREPLLPDLRCPSVVFSADGTKLYGSQVDPEKVAAPRQDGELVPLVSWVYDMKAKKQTALGLPPGHMVTDTSPDGKTLLTVTFKPNATVSSARSYIVPLDTLKPRPLTETVLKGMRFSPDGKRVLGTRLSMAGAPALPVLVSVAVADGAEKPIPLPAGVVLLERACWSPDGKRIAYNWHEEITPPANTIPANGKQPKQYACQVTMADADGRNAKTISSGDAFTVKSLDWK
ncbi:MAG TPA: sigma-70 family RNA polymerase sigma factor [Gemmata sp.]